MTTNAVTMMPRLRSIRQAAEETGISYHRLRTWCLQGLIKSKYFGKKRMIDVNEVIELVTSEALCGGSDDAWDS